MKKTFPRLDKSLRNDRGTDRNRRASDYLRYAQRDRQTSATTPRFQRMWLYARTYDTLSSRKGGNLWLYKEYEESPLALCRTWLLTMDVRALSLWGVAGG